MIPSPGWIFLILCALLACSALLSALTHALHTLSRSRLSAFAQTAKHERHAKRLDAIADDPDAHAAAIAIARVFINLVAALASVYWLTGILDLEYATPTSIAGGVLIATALLWIVSIIIPAAVANHAGEHTVAAFALPLRAAHTAAIPILTLARFTDEVVRRLSGSSDTQRNDEINAEILSAVAEGQREGHLDDADREMLEAVVEFRSTLAESVMTPRTEIDALEYTDDLDAVNRFLDEHGHSRVPVYTDNLDHVQGVLYAKDVLRWLTNNKDNHDAFNLRELLREPTFVPETKTVRELLEQLLADKVHIAIIIDEYGGTSGLVTIEDIVEEIFGEIQDEYEDPEDEPKGAELDELGTSAELDARTEIDDANDDLQPLGIAIPESDDYDTVAGYINASIGRIPDPGESFNTEHMRVDVLEAEPTRVVRVRVEPLTHPDDQPEDQTEQRPESQTAASTD